MIEISGFALYQWDTGRYVTVKDITADHVHFSNKGDSKAVIMEISDSLAKIPDYLLQTGKQVCVYVVRDGITVESKIFSVIKREKPEDYIYEEDQRNFVYELIKAAETATEAASHAAETATEATHSADGAANRATTAAVAAEKASVDANKAANKAAQTAKSLMVIGGARGAAIHLDDAIEQPLVSLRVFGKTVQDGVPTPDAPVDLVSVGDDGNVGVAVAGKNLVDITKAVQTGTERIEVQGDTIVIGAGSGLYGVKLNGVVLEVGRTYTMSVGSVSQHDANFGFRIIYDDGTSSNTFGDNSAVTLTVTKPIQSVYFYVGYGMSATSQIVIKQLQIEEGAIRTAYEPYHMQPLTISTPNGLPGIPVTSGGNYTDANGKQWICDEIDFARGVYVQRVGEYICTGNETWGKSGSQNEALVSAGLVRYDATIPGHPKAGSTYVLSTHCLYAGVNNFKEESGMSAWVSADDAASSLPVRIAAAISTVEGLKVWLAEQYAARTPVRILYILKTPIEAPLSEEEIAAYNALRTYRGNTTVSNDAGAYMELEYVMDAKKYIDSQISTGIIEARVG